MRRLVLLRAEDDLRHRLHGLDRILADGALAGKHHRVGAVHHGVRDVGDLRARRHRIVDHRLHHLRRRDRDAIALARRRDDVLLQTGQLGVTDFDAEIAARDHHGVARLDDAIEIHERLAALDLRDEIAVSALLAQQLARLVHVAAVARERNGHIVDAELGRELDVGAILVGQRARRQAAALLVDALVVGQLAADRRRA